MKTQTSFLHRAPQRGVALVIVLSMLLLLSALLVAFMSSVSTERQSARATAATFEAKQAYESAVNLVISQIRQATQNDDGTVGWASQPGLIRTFGNNDDDKFVYKLYSSDNLVQKASDYKPESPEESLITPSTPLIDPPGSVDMNSPLLIPIEGDKKGAVRAIYPIADPFATLNYSTSAKGDEPLAPGMESIKGFTAFKIEGKDQTLRDGLDRVVRRLPMRVKWLYQMRDGTISAADASGVIAKATKKNPPIARFAFWTDDETCKLNLNTAGEYTYWDTPMTSTAQDSGRIDGAGDIDQAGLSTSLELASSQPAVGEYQRYPGHPATVGLSPALRWLFQPPTQANGEPPASDPRDRAYKEQLFRLLPRYHGGYTTSVSGTRNSYLIYFNPTTGIKKVLSEDPRLTKRDRLFSTIDEFWFRPDRSPLTSNGIYSVFLPETSANKVAATAQVMDTNVFTKTPAATIDRLRLFLTAVSRAPDLNLQGKPRISIWPLPDELNKRSTFDKVANFCSTIPADFDATGGFKDTGRNSYSFQRQKPWSPTYDFEAANNGRNKKLFQYLQNLTSVASPGTNKSFSSKYGADRDQILTMIFDYVRSTNLVDTANESGNTIVAGKSLYHSSFTPGYDALAEGDINKYTQASKSFPGSGMVIPTLRREGNVVNRGMGRFLTVSEVGLLFFRDTQPRPAQNVPDDVPIAGFDTDTQSPVVPPEKRNNEVPLRCVLIPEMFSVSPGYPAMSESYAYTVTEVEPFQFVGSDGAPYDFKMARGDANYVEVDPWRSQDGRFFMPTRSFPNQFQYDSDPKGARTSKIFVGSDGSVSNPLDRADYSKYPFFSRRFYVRSEGTAAPTQFKFKGGKLKIDFYSLAIKDAQSPGFHTPYEPGIIQTINIDFPSGITTVDLPTKTAEVLFRDIPTKMNLSPDDGQFQQFAIRSMEVNGLVRGDTRLVQGLFEVPSSYYSPAGMPGTYAGTTRLVHNLRSSWGRPYAGLTTFGSVTPSNISRPTKKVDLPANILGIPSIGGASVGDYDRGMSKHTDGPFINKTDEGNIRMKLDDDFAGGGAIPYYRGAGGYDEVGANFFSPNRIVPSAVMFGSLPSGVRSTPPRPWETLLFCPPVGSPRGALAPADHFLLDLFTMPIVEPYAISEPLSTAGRINLNHRLAPWGYVKAGNKSYIERTTALHGVLQGMYQLAIPSSTPELAHNESPLGNATTGTIVRQPIDPYATIEQSINAYINTKGYFRSPSQICEMDLLTKTPPTGVIYTPFRLAGLAGRTAFWRANDQTGDNGRERPYAQIYPRLTTKSNTYTVHIWAQGLAKNPATKDGEWDKFDEDRDRVIGEFRGSTTLERYLDPNDPAIKDYDATKSTSKGLDSFYRFRILSSRRFVAQ
jgi:uncharacterized protein (TIGR02600 family)